MTSSDCPFCAIPAERVIWRSDLCYAVRDIFPASPGHALVIPRRHCAGWFEATRAEQHAILEGLEALRRMTDAELAPDGYNIGVNVGAPAGQTVFHLHVHLIPRYDGDVPDPRGGVRHVIPRRGNYLAAPFAAPHAEMLVDGGTAPDRPDPLLEHLLPCVGAADEMDFVLAFLLPSGLACLEGPLREARARGARIRLLTGDYLGATDPDVLQRVLDLPLDARVYECGGTSFHPKAWIFRWRDGRGVAFVGSSNLSRPALVDGIEWNARVARTENPAGFAKICASFERLLAHPRVRPLTRAWIADYRTRWAGPVHVLGDAEAEEVRPLPLEPADPQPTSLQREALSALEDLRQAGGRKALIVLATGLGKTYLAAFDSHRPQFRRVLFVAHREEILEQARRTFERVRATGRSASYGGSPDDLQVDALFSSVQTLGRHHHLHRFDATHFDYVVVDEFHHAAAATYRRLLDYFQPKFLLGLTATPDRTDGADLLYLCDGLVAYECGLVEGIERHLLAPFEYFGVPDEVDYANIPWRGGRFDEEALTTAVATRRRAENALDQWRGRGGQRTIAFCVSQRHADFMARFFTEHGVPAAAVHTGAASAPRTESLAALREGALTVLFAVDLFNEGLDLPEVDTVMMLRPTESRVIWLQQLGRGLRKSTGKERLTVIDYIGNHRAFLMKPRALFSLPPGDANLARLLGQLRKGPIELAPGCHVTYELQAMDILASVLRPAKEDALKLFCEDFQREHGVRPTALETFLAGLDPRAAKGRYGSWPGLLHGLGMLSQEETRAVEAGRDFLAKLETTQMTRSYKMAVLLGMLSADQVPGTMTVADLTIRVRRLLEQNSRLRADFPGEVLLTGGALERLLRENPLHFLATGPDRRFFRLDGDAFATEVRVPPEAREAFAGLVRELVEWRLEAYLRRSKA